MVPSVIPPSPNQTSEVSGIFSVGNVSSSQSSETIGVRPRFLFRINAAILELDGVASNSFSCPRCVRGLDRWLAASFLLPSCKTDGAFLFVFWRAHHVVDGFKDGFETYVVFLFKGDEFFGKFGIGGEHLSQSHKGSHDFDVDLNGAFAVQDAGEHGDTLFGEGVGGVTATAASGGFFV